MNELTNRLLDKGWPILMASECGRSRYHATAWLTCGHILPEESLELLGVECHAPVGIMRLYREFVSDDPLSVHMWRVAQMTPPEERLDEDGYNRNRRHYMADDLFDKSKGVNYGVLDQVHKILTEYGLASPEPTRATYDRGNTARLLLQNCENLRESRGLRNGLVASALARSVILAIDPDCKKLETATRTALESFEPVSRPHDSPHEVLTIPHSESEACLAMLNYAVCGAENGDLETDLQAAKNKNWALRLAAAKRNAPKLFPGAAHAASAELTNLMMERKLSEVRKADENYLQRKPRGR